MIAALGERLLDGMSLPKVINVVSSIISMVQPLDRPTGRGKPSFHILKGHHDTTGIDKVQSYRDEVSPNLRPKPCAKEPTRPDCIMKSLLSTSSSQSTRRLQYCSE